MRSIDTYINRKIVILNESATVHQAAKAIAMNGIGSVMVTDGDGHVTGIVTDRDLACRALAKSHGPRTRLREIMTGGIESVSENSSIEDAIGLMEKFGVRRLPVLRELRGGRQKCVGIVTLDDLIVADEIDHEKTRRIVQSQMLRRLHGGRHTADKSLAKGDTEFIKRLSGLLETSEKQAESFAKFLFTMVSRRLTYTGALQFIRQLPVEFHAKLLSLSPGPDRMISVREVLQGVAGRLGLSADASRGVLRKTWELLHQYGDKEELNHTLAQLPGDFRELLSEARAGEDYPEYSSIFDS